MSDFTFSGLPASAFALTPPQGQPQAPGTSARDILASALANASKVAKDSPGKINDTLAEMSKQADIIAKEQSPDKLAMENLKSQASAAAAMAQYEKDNPTPAPQLLQGENVSPLSLPGVPQNVQPRPNGVASLGAGLAGLFAPRAAGAFGAAALSGALQAARRENDVKQEQYKLNLQQTLLKHQEEVRRADAQAGIDARNNALTNSFTQAKHAENLEQAQDAQKAALLNNEAGNYEKFINGNAPAEAAKVKAQQLSAQLKALEEQSKDANKTLIDTGKSLAQFQEWDRKIQEAKDKTTAAAAKDLADRTSREKIANQSNATRLNVANLTNDRQFKLKKMEIDKDLTIASNRNAIEIQKMERELGKTGLMEHPTFEMTAAKEEMDAARTKREHAYGQLNSPSSNNPNFDKNTPNDPALTARRRAEAQLADKEFKDAQQKYLDAGTAMRKLREAGSYVDPTTGRRKSKPTGTLPPSTQNPLGIRIQ